MKRGMTLWRYFTDSQEHAGGFIMVKAVVGANWGDEGKGKITDMLAEKADIIIRFQGGANAGHTIISERAQMFRCRRFWCQTVHRW